MHQTRSDRVGLGVCAILFQSFRDPPARNQKVSTRQAKCTPSTRDRCRRCPPECGFAEVLPKKQPRVDSRSPPIETGAVPTQSADMLCSNQDATPTFHGAIILETEAPARCEVGNCAEWRSHHAS